MLPSSIRPVGASATVKVTAIRFGPALVDGQNGSPISGDVHGRHSYEPDGRSQVRREAHAGICQSRRGNSLRLWTTMSDLLQG